MQKIPQTYAEAQIKSFEILKRKAESGHKDVDGFIKSKIINEEPIAVIIIIGKAGIIDNDIKHQLQEAIDFYKFHFVRINLTSEKEIIESLVYYAEKCDILAVLRGRGENLEVFDSPEITEPPFPFQHILLLLSLIKIMCPCYNELLINHLSLPQHLVNTSMIFIKTRYSSYRIQRPNCQRYYKAVGRQLREAVREPNLPFTYNPFCFAKGS